MYCHTEMPCRRHRTRHPTSSQYTDTGLTCRCAIHWCGTSHWNTQLPILMSWTRPGNPSPIFHTHQRTLNLMLSWWSTVESSVESTVPTGSWTRDLWCANPVRYPLAHSDFLELSIKFPSRSITGWWSRGGSRLAPLLIRFNLSGKIETELK